MSEDNMNNNQGNRSDEIQAAGRQLSRQNSQPSKLSCREAEFLISEALDRRLQASTDRVLRRHIFSCPSCRKVYQDHLSLQNLVQNQPEAQVSPDFMEVLEARIAAGEGTPTAALDAPIPLARKLKLFSSGMGTAAALLLSAWLILDEISSPPLPNSSQAQTPVAASTGTSTPLPVRGPVAAPMRSVADGEFGNEGLPGDEFLLGRAHPLTPLSSQRSSSKPSTPGLQPENLGRLKKPNRMAAISFTDGLDPSGAVDPHAVDLDPVDLVDPARFAIGLFKGTLQSLEKLKADTKHYQNFPPQKATEEIFRSAEEARDCTHLLLKLDRSLIDLNAANETWLKKVHEKLQKITALRLAIQENKEGAGEALKKIKELVQGISTKAVSNTNLTIRIKFESNLRDSLLGSGMPPGSLQRALRVFSQTAGSGQQLPDPVFLFNGGDLRIFLIQGAKK
ncbi:MAG TPA: zf-HC2 domain-containing protein [Planctomycetes bacterium]|nr:zf-HC2 domain-containing protein [Planctomycetota bacterium]